METMEGINILQSEKTCKAPNTTNQTKPIKTEEKRAQQRQRAQPIRKQDKKNRDGFASSERIHAIEFNKNINSVKQKLA